MSGEDPQYDLGYIRGKLELFEKRLGNIEKDVRDLRSIADTGKGALRTALKVGAVIAAIVAISIGILNYFKA